MCCNAEQEQGDRSENQDDDEQVAALESHEYYRGWILSPSGTRREKTWPGKPAPEREYILSMAKRWGSILCRLRPKTAREDRLREGSSMSLVFQLAFRFISLERQFLTRGISGGRNHMRVSTLESAKAQIRVVLIALHIPQSPLS